VILRPETEWVELVECGTAIIADANEKKILNAFDMLTTKADMTFPKLYGDGKAAEFICGEMVENLS
jgi:UDP-GlcNAc3NAcA epimerase